MQAWSWLGPRQTHLLSSSSQAFAPPPTPRRCARRCARRSFHEPTVICCRSLYWRSESFLALTPHGASITPNPTQHRSPRWSSHRGVRGCSHRIGSVLEAYPAWPSPRGHGIPSRDLVGLHPRAAQKGYRGGNGLAGGSRTVWTGDDDGLMYLGEQPGEALWGSRKASSLSCASCAGSMKARFAVRVASAWPSPSIRPAFAVRDGGAISLH